MTEDYESEDVNFDEEQQEQDPLASQMEEVQAKQKITPKQREARVKNLAKGRKKHQENAVRRKIEAEQLEEEIDGPAYESESEEEIIVTKRPKKKYVEQPRKVKKQQSEQDKRLDRIEKLLELQARREKYKPKSKSTIVNVMAEPKPQKQVSEQSKRLTKDILLDL